MSKLRDFVSRRLWDLCRLIPVKQNRVVFCSYNGRGYSDSPKAICEALRATGEKLDLCWLVRSQKDAGSLPEDVRPVPYHGFARLKALATAKVWVDNCRKYENVKKKSQFYLQTWHGFALKRIEADVPPAHLEPDYVEACRRDSAQCDLIVSGSKFMSGLYRNSFWYDGEVAETGTPRNDVFFNERARLHGKACRTLGLPEETRLLLYAPTFRADRSTDAYCLDTGAVHRAVTERLGGQWTVLIRLHPNVGEQSEGLFAYDGVTVTDATAYPDMQELLCAADLLITDYSSSMFDFALTGKPVLLFAPDLEAYANDRNFYFPPEKLPFPLCTDNDGLLRQIAVLTPGENAAWEAFARETGFCEDGKASERCAQLILRKIRKEKRA